MQTLVLDLGSTYTILVAPPVYGTDFTGVPQPTIAYNWKVNGTAIGETSNSIDNVIVDGDEAGAIVLTDGDIISVDITIANSVSAATKTASATISTAVPAPSLPPLSIRKQVYSPAASNYVTLPSIPNSDIGIEVRVASSEEGLVVTTPPGATLTYQWRRGFASIAGATLQTYTLQAADEDSILDCVVTATNATGSVTRTATTVVGTVPNIGWTDLSPSADSRLIYIANDGDDTAAKAAKGGRGYYLLSDPEIGPDPLNPVGPIVSYSNPVEAYRKVRGIGWSHETADFKDVYSRTNRETLQAVSQGGWPDWLLFRRGDTFGRVEDPDLGNVNVGDMFQNAIASYMTWSYNPLAENTARYEGGGISGRSQSEPFVMSAWGPVTAARPVFHGGFTLNGRLRDAVISSIDCQPTSDPLYPGNRYGFNFGNPGESAYGAWRNVLVEDCRSQGHGMISMAGGGPSTNLTVRRSTWTDGWQSGGHNSSPYNGLADGARLTYEECVFDKNGYKENPADATKWSGEFSSALTTGGISGTIEPGQGVQATRTWFDRNWYMAGTGGDTMVLRGNIAARTGGGAEQMRSGGVAERNLFLFNHDGMLMGVSDDSYGVHDTLMKQNVFLHDDVFLPPGGWGMNSFSQGGRTVVVDSVYAHPHRGANGPGTFFFWQVRNYESAARALLDTAYFARMGRGFSTQRSGESLDHPAMTVSGNEIAIGTTFGFGYGAIARSSKSPSDTIDGNLYWGDPSASRFSVNYGISPQNLTSTNRTFAQWQADGYDTNSQMISDWAAFKTAAGWADPDRDIVSYMQSIDPTYEPDEDVRVDYGSAVGRADAPLVRTVALGTGFGQIPEDANARLAARRFHAAITFLNRARENRKGAWDDRYTAEAVCNYIRVGFGKAAVTGLYDTRDLATRMSDHL
jgi:hypothetical protein